MSETKFPISANVKAKFRGFKFKSGENPKTGASWQMIEAAFATDENWLNQAWWQPDKTSFTKSNGETVELGSIESQEQKLYNKVLHILESFGISKDDISTEGTLEEFFNLVNEKAKEHIGKEVYLKTLEKKEKPILGFWFKFVSSEPNMEYSERELEYLKTAGISPVVLDNASTTSGTDSLLLDIPDDDLPF